MLEACKSTSGGAVALLLTVMTFSCSATASLLNPPATATGDTPTRPALQQQNDDPTKVVMPLEGIHHENGKCYQARIPLIVPNERDEGRTGIRLFEDGVELTHSASHHDEIRNNGGGRFSQWGETLYFSSTDGSDPMTNGRHYTIAFSRDIVLDQTSWHYTKVADIPADAIRSDRACEFIYDLPPAIAGWPSDAETANGSRLVLLEDGSPLAYPHTSIEAIRTRGAGRYEHLRDQLHFSSSDNSNPKTNGRVYTIALSDRPNHRFVDPAAGHAAPLAEVLPSPTIDSPKEGEVIGNARPTCRVQSPDPSLLYYWELDVVPTFDSPDLHRQPRMRESRDGGTPQQVLDREPTFGPEFTPPYRLGALAPTALDRDADSYTAMMAGRLAYGLNTGPDQLQEVFAYVSSQFYPTEDSPEIHGVSDTWQRDRGDSASVNYLASRILEEMGYRTRRVAQLASSSGGPASRLSNHSSMEVFWDGHWSIFDPWLGYYLDGVSYEALAGSPDEPRFLAMRYCPNPNIVDLKLNSVYLTDFARRRRYDHFDTYYAAVSSASSERLAFSGEPGVMPNVDWHMLWSNPQMRVFVRVRSVRLGPDNVCSWLAPTLDAMQFQPQQIEVSPWTTVSFTIDLAAAYGFGQPAKQDSE